MGRSRVCSHQRSLGVGGSTGGGTGRRRGGARHRPGPELPPGPAWLTYVRTSRLARRPLTREHVRRSQAPQGPLDDPPTALQGGQEGCLVLRHQGGYLNGGHDRDGGRASLYLSGQPVPPPPESSTWAEFFCSSGYVSPWRR